MILQCLHGLLKSEIRNTKSETNSNLKIPNDLLPQSFPLEGEGRVRVAEVSDFFVARDAVES
jgi:hypothetical protein